MIQLGVLQATLVGRRGKRKERLVPSGELVDGGAVHRSIVGEENERALARPPVTTGPAQTIALAVARLNAFEVEVASRVVPARRYKQTC